ncbi:hypothetical protein F4677DRAFT_323422 [Hypoxylon crocopeplum]|nr:hypothetical protein F4677DRAFT_323422 [Hypoxylon crocopeplum]
MRILDLFNAALLATGVAAKCATNDCLRAVQDVTSSLREEDCKSFVDVTVTPATSTIFSSTTMTTTGTTTRTTTQTITSPAEPSKRWIQRHEIIDVLLGRAVSSDSPVTVKATAIPTYASQCVSSAAYDSACSCLGISAVTVTVPTPSITKVLRIVETTTIASIHTAISYVNGSSLFKNSTDAKFGNSTAHHLNATSSGLSPSSGISSSSSIISSSSSLLSATDPATSSDKYKLKRPSTEEVASSTEVVSALITASSSISSLVDTSSVVGFSNTTSFSFPNTTTSAGRFSNVSDVATQPGIANATSSATQPGITSGPMFQNGTTSTVNNLNTATSAPLLNATQATGANATNPAPFLNSTQVAVVNATSSSTVQFSNSTTSPPFMNITSVPSLNNTLAPFFNSTQAAILNATSSTALFPNSTISAPFMNITSAPSLNLTNSTSAPFLNATHVPFFLNATTTAPFANSTSSIRLANTTSTTATATPTSTCETTSAPFAVRVVQPGGLFDGWYLQVSGEGVIFNPSLSLAARFSFDSSEHLCATGGAGLIGNASAVVAIAENRTDAAGSAVWFVEPGLLEDIENDREGHRWYAPLECDGAGTGANSTVGNSTALTCAQGAKEYWVGCGLGLDITSDGDGVAVVDGWNCTAVTLSIEYSA